MEDVTPQKSQTCNTLSNSKTERESKSTRGQPREGGGLPMTEGGKERGRINDRNRAKTGGHKQR